MPRSPLHAEHVRLGARFVDFASWEMPIQYDSVLSEHQVVRKAAGVFDVSHLGRFLVEGNGSTNLLRSLLCNDIINVDPGAAQYTMSLNEAGGVLDDIIVWRWSDERYWVIPNGANDDGIRARFRAAAPSSVTIESIREDTVLVALQGPDSPRVFKEIFGLVPDHFRVTTGEFRGTPVQIAGTGYTGERGGEIAITRGAGVAMFHALLNAGAAPCGLGARDTLRLEMGYPLWGQDLDESTTPLEAGLRWVVKWDHEFVGKAALQRQMEQGLPKRQVAFVMDGRQIARHGYPMRAGASSGTVTSGNFSPVLGRGIGLGYLSPPAEPDATIEVQIRGKWVSAHRAKLPFIGRR
ncbi:MAG: glycine cleavage system aminomethyltransferase GcvT [Gammaproteobacteria bacterium]|nr:glycine cleavage system aminomethyltransferase GcvT [Gammaproteobacteria bacterium]